MLTAKEVLAERATDTHT